MFVEFDVPTSGQSLKILVSTDQIVSVTPGNCSTIYTITGQIEVCTPYSRIVEILQKGNAS